MSADSVVQPAVDAVKVKDRKEKKEKKDKKDKKEKKEKKDKEKKDKVEDAQTEDVLKVETKEERRARKAAKKAAKASKEAARPPLTTTESERQVEQVLAKEPSTPPTNTIPASTQEDEESKSPKKEKKRRERDGETEEERKQKKDSKRKLKAERAAQETVDTATSAAQVDAETVIVQAEAYAQAKKDKKEKRKRGEVEDEADGEQVQAEPTVESSAIAVPPPAEGTEGKKSKSKKKKVKIVEDKEDEVSGRTDGVYGHPDISDSAKKAIDYCQQYAASHGAGGASDDAAPRWKFNKAKQIWLVRHLWDDAEVPDEYLDIVVGYLKTVQGMGRAGLIEAAKKRRDATVPVAPTTEQETDGDVRMGEQPNGQSEPGVGTQEPQAQQVDVDAERKMNVTRARAVKLLRAMGAR